MLQPRSQPRKRLGISLLRSLVHSMLLVCNCLKKLCLFITVQRIFQRIFLHEPDFHIAVFNNRSILGRGETFKTPNYNVTSRSLSNATRGIFLLICDSRYTHTWQSTVQISSGNQPLFTNMEKQLWLCCCCDAHWVCTTHGGHAYYLYTYLPYAQEEESSLESLLSINYEFKRYTRYRQQ